MSDTRYLPILQRMRNTLEQWISEGAWKPTDPCLDVPAFVALAALTSVVADIEIGTSDLQDDRRIMNAHQRTTLRRLRDWCAGHPDRFVVDQVTGTAAAQALMVIDECLFRIDFQCGCTVRLFLFDSPQTSQRFHHAPGSCDLKRMAFVAE